jgi:hypothetical protein
MNGKHELRQRGELVGEAALLTVVGFLFIYILAKSFEWPLGAALMPRISVALGLPFLALRILALLGRGRQTLQRGPIMDTGFQLGGDTIGEARRFARICIFIVALYLGIWVLGFHVALPLGVFVYLVVYGKLSIVASGLVSLCFIALIVGMYDYAIHTDWGEPLGLRAWSWAQL